MTHCPLPNVAPGKPSLDVTAGDGAVSFTITDGTNDGPTVSGRKIYYTDGTTSKEFFAALSTTGIITGLTNGTEYTFQATTFSSAGESPKSDPKTATPNV